MHRDEIDGAPDVEVAWASDVAAQMLRRFGIKYVSINPGASYRGFHDSLVNHLGNENPSILLCLHEDHAVAIAHGYAKATGGPMACALHSNVGLMHGMMAIYNAWSDRVPMLIMGATGPVDAARRRPWVDWLHTAADQGGMIRDFVKFDNQPASASALIDAMCRANIVTRTEPTAPVYICLDAGLQETRLDKPPQWPQIERFRAPAAPGPSLEAVDKIAKLLAASKKPLIAFGRGRRSIEAWSARIALAERLGACVITDMRTGAVFPSDHPAHTARPMAHANDIDRELAGEADLVIALEWCDLGGLVAPPGKEPLGAHVINVGLDHVLHNGAHMGFQQLAPADLSIAASGDEIVASLVAALGPGSRPPWAAKRASKPDIRQETITVPLIAAELKAAFGNIDNVSLSTVSRGWPCDLWPIKDPQSFMGKDGGGGIGAGPGLAVGVALAMHERGRHTVALLGDGDFAMGCQALWRAVHHKIPVLILVNNNRAYLNDEIHQEHVAHDRHRNVRNRWIGQRIGDPTLDFAMIARGQGAVGIGPVTKVGDVGSALREAVAVLKAGNVCLVDFHVTAGQERGLASTGYRA
jgi:thiamine pyrophosphate-dependent acetolactate synthase large subunit-like protein